MATVNNNWPTPVATDLVKDGWEAIKDLGDAIDTTLGVYADPGLVLLNTTSFSAVASQALPANTFDATYDNYKIVIDFENPSADNYVAFKFRASGVDSSTGYYWAFTGRDANGVDAPDQGVNQTVGLPISFQDNSITTHNYSSDFTLHYPFLTKFTTMTGVFVGTSNSSVLRTRSGGGTHYVATSYDSINVIASAGNISGVIRVYGINQ